MAQVSFAEFPETRQRYIPHPVCKAIGPQRASVSRRCYHNKPAFTGTITAPGGLKGGRLGRNLGGICIFFFLSPNGEGVVKSNDRVRGEASLKTLWGGGRVFRL